MHCIMKITVIISVALVTQVSASFFDVFQGAVLSVQTSFGKLLSDVVTDVKITVDCTILAVEHVLSLSDDATDRYYEQCKGATEPNTPTSNTGQNSESTTAPPKFEGTIQVPNEDLKKTLPAEINATVNKTLTKILDDYNLKNKLVNVEDVLAKETERLANVSVLVKEELDKLASEVNSDLRRIEHNDSPPPTIETVLDKINSLQDMEQNDKNSTEAQEIHQVVEKVLDKLDVIESTEASENVRFEEMLRDMETNSNNSFSDLEKQFDDWKDEKFKHLDDIKSKIEDEKEISKHRTSEDASNHLSESISNSTIELQSENTMLMDINPEIIVLPFKNESSENATGYLTNVTNKPLKIISTGLPTTNKPILEMSTLSTNLQSIQINSTEQIVITNNSNLSFEESSNLVGVQSSYVSTSSVNLTTSTIPEIAITTDSTSVTQNTAIDQLKTNPTSVDENMTLPISDHVSETTSETIFLNSFSNYSDSPVVIEYIEPYKDTTIDSTSATISTNTFSTYSDMNEDPDDATTSIDSSITTYEPFIPETVLIDKYYDKKDANSDENKTFDLDNPKTTSESAVVPTVIYKDYQPTHKPVHSDHFAVRPLIDVSTKSIASNWGTSGILRKDEDSQINPTVYTSDAIDSTTEANKESIVLTTNKPDHGNDLKMKKADKISLDYDAFFNSKRQHSPIHKKAVKDARKLIEDSKNTDLIMKSILKHKKAGRSVFNYRAPANFGE